MTDEEINQAVAKRLGWKPTRTKYSTFDGQHDAEVIRYRESRLPDYCHSLEAAWEIVEQVQTKPEHWIACRWKPLCENESGGKWNCMIVWQKANSPNGEEHRILGNSYADTAPRAICLAFLALPEAS